MPRLHSPIAALLALAVFGISPALGQVQNLITVPAMNVNDSFYENYGVRWNYNRMRPRGGFFFNNGGSGSTAPAFGGFDPNSSATFGVGVPNGGINFTAAQGSSRSIVGNSASLMVPNGGGGSIFSGSVRPFVTGIVPVVGAGGPRMINPLEIKLQQLREQGGFRSSERETESLGAVEDAPLRLGGSDPAGLSTAQSAATAPAGSITALRQQRAAEVARQREQARQRILTARRAESEGRKALARSEYRLALQLIAEDDPWRSKIIERLRALLTNP